LTTPEAQSLIRRIEAFQTRITHILGLFTTSGEVAIMDRGRADGLLATLMRDLDNEAERVGGAGSRASELERGLYASKVHEASLQVHQSHGIHDLRGPLNEANVTLELLIGSLLGE
jgi:hypothetical protein